MPHTSELQNLKVEAIRNREVTNNIDRVGAECNFVKAFLYSLKTQDLYKLYDCRKCEN